MEREMNLSSVCTRTRRGNGKVCVLMCARARRKSFRGAALRRSAGQGRAVNDRVQHVDMFFLEQALSRFPS